MGAGHMGPLSERMCSSARRTSGRARERHSKRRDPVSGRTAIPDAELLRHPRCRPLEHAACVGPDQLNFMGVGRDEHVKVHYWWAWESEDALTAFVRWRKTPDGVSPTVGKMLPFTLTLPPGTSAAPSPLKRICSTIAIGCGTPPTMLNPLAAKT